MLEQADMSGRIDPDDFTDNDILELFDIKGLQMLVIDAIVGNGDRHAGNFGFLRSADTGEYIGMSPLYDFDHALDSENEYDRLIKDLVEITLSNKLQDEVIRICKIVLTETTNDIFNIRANSILRLLDVK